MFSTDRSVAVQAHGSHGCVLMGHETPLQALIVLPSLGYCGNSSLPSGRPSSLSFFLWWIFSALHNSELEKLAAFLSVHLFLQINLSLFSISFVIPNSFPCSPQHPNMLLA